jgi:hypothetical protein
MAQDGIQYYKISNMFRGAQQLEVPPGTKKIRISTVAAKSLLDMSSWEHRDLPQEIDVLCTLGLVDIRLPRDIRVELQGTGLFGAFAGNARHTHPIPGTPVVVRGLVGFGAVEVRVPVVE